MVTNTALSKIKMESLTTVGGFVDVRQPNGAIHDIAHQLAGPAPSHHSVLPQISENAKLTDIEMENLIYIGGDLNVRP